MFCRNLAVAALALTASLAASSPALAAFPDKTVRLIVAYPPGGATDSQARIVAQKLAEKWGQTVVVENRPGGNTVIATSAVATAPADGHTLLLTAMPFALNPLLMDKLPYDSRKDLAPVTLLSTIPSVLVANKASGIGSVAELISKAKASDGAISFASTGQLAVTHLAGELFADMADVKLTHVAYKGSAPAHQDLLGGNVQIMFDNGIRSLVEAGRVQPLAVTSAARLSWLPAVPTLAEAGLKGYEAAAWFGILTTGGTPAAVVDQLAADISWALRTPEVRARFETLGASTGGGTPAEFQAYLDQEAQRWGALLKRRGIKAQ